MFLEILGNVFEKLFFITSLATSEHIQKISVVFTKEMLVRSSRQVDKTASKT